MKPHLYFWGGHWFVSRNERSMWRRGLALNDVQHASFAQACESAKWWMENRSSFWR